VDNLPDGIKIGEKYDPAMKIEDQAEADAYFELCVAHTIRVGKVGRVMAESIERQNLGYYAGYCSNETRERVERLFKCAHPIFGAIALVGTRTPDQIVEAGQDLARRSNRR
jgi:hypothetical protein